MLSNRNDRNNVTGKRKLFLRIYFTAWFLSVLLISGIPGSRLLDFISPEKQSYVYEPVLALINGA